MSLRSRFALCLALLVPVALPAATPESGVITDRSATLEWSGGPFVVPNASNIISADEIVLDVIPQHSICEEDTGQTCDVYRFEINVGGVDADNELLVIAVEWDNTPAEDDGLPENGILDPRLPDYDLELYDDATGELIDSKGTGGDNPETIVRALADGKYRLQVMPYAPMASTYKGTIRVSNYDEESKAARMFSGAFAPMALLLLALGGLARRMH